MSNFLLIFFWRKNFIAYSHPEFSSHCHAVPLSGISIYDLNIIVLDPEQISGRRQRFKISPAQRDQHPLYPHRHAEFSSHCHAVPLSGISIYDLNIIVLDPEMNSGRRQRFVLDPELNSG